MAARQPSVPNLILVNGPRRALVERVSWYPAAVGVARLQVHRPVVISSNTACSSPTRGLIGSRGPLRIRSPARSRIGQNGRRRYWVSHRPVSLVAGAPV